MDNHIATNDLKEVLKEYPKYQLFEASFQRQIIALVADEVEKNHG